jgi:hypothetical protein
MGRRTHSSNQLRTSNRRQRPCRLSTCSCGKVRFPDHTAAVQALHDAATSRYFAEQEGTTTNRGEVRSYRCRLCSGWHLTSKAVPARVEPSTAEE